uniref:C-JID domain-containing protein n=1 Tax=Quercus lobata TaxID=97700 RepID=A0A7N2MGE2_QUELO
MKSLSRLNLAWTAIKKVEPSSIKCLPALTFLDLRYCTNLECLPSNMDNMRFLETLDLSQCLKLKSLPRLPSTVRFMGAKGCSSLKWSPERVKLSIWSQPFSQWLPYDESGSEVGFTILFHFLKVQGLLCRKAVLDGSIIPSCLAEIEGNSISIELPSNWYNDKWIGFALWASLPIVGYHVMALGDMPQNHCASENIRIYVDVNNELDVNICLLYLSRDDWFAKVGNGECSKIKVIFKTDKSTIGIKGKCGVSLIYKQDVDEFNETNAQCLIKSFGEVSIYKLIASDDDVHIVDDDDDDVHIVRDDVLIVGDDDFDDDDI